MNKHGGKRHNAGRPRALPLCHRIAIGWMCESARDKHAVRVALERIETEYKRQDAVRVRDELNAENARRVAAIEKLRLRGESEMTLDSAQAKLQEWQAIAYKKRLAEVAPILEKTGRFLSTADYRPRALSRPRVYKQVAEECEKLGWGKITVRQIRDCWRDHDPELFQES